MAARRLNRVLFDGGILFAGTNNSSSRSGIFVASYEILRALLRRSDLTIDIWCEDANLGVAIRQFCRNDPALANLNFFNANQGKGVEEFLDRLKGFELPLQRHRSYLVKLLWFSYRIHRHCLIWLAQVLLGFRNLFWIRRLKKRYDVFLSPVYASPLIIRKAGLRRYTILYDTIPMLFPQFYVHLVAESWTSVLARSLDEDDYGFAISSSTKRDFLRFSPRLRADHVSVIPLAASERFSVCTKRSRIVKALRKYGVPEGRPYFLSLCTIEPRKNLAFALKAFAEVAKSNPDVIFVLAGARWPEYDEKWKGVLAGLSAVKDRIVLTGYVDDEDLSPLYSGAMAFVYLSVYEGFGLPPLEAMQCGCPVLCSNNSSLPEVVGESALTVPADDLLAAVKAMERLAGDPALRNRLRSEGLDRAKLFSWDRAAEIMADRMAPERERRRVLFDASILRQGLGKGSRSGIFTVATELLREFLKRDDISVDLFVPAADDSEDVIRRFVGQDPVLSNCGFTSLGRNPYVDSRDALTAVRLQRPAALVSLNGFAWVCYRISLALFKCVLGVLSWLYERGVSRSLARRYSACLSPVFRLPKWIRASRVPRYTILYDTIPMIFPNLYPHVPGSLWVEQVAASLTKDDKGFAISQSAKADFLRFSPGLREENVTVIPLAASERFAVCRDAGRIAAVLKKYGIPQDKPYFLCLSSIEPRKNFPFTIRAFAGFARTQGDVNLVLAGKPWKEYNAVMEDAMAAAGEARSRIFTTGYVDDEDLSPLYSGALAFVFLSLYEGFGLPPLEAMQCGCPVICSNTSSLPEVVGDAALTVSPDDFDGVVSALTRIASDPSLRATLRDRGLLRCQLFSWKKAAEIVLAKMLGSVERK